MSSFQDFQIKFHQHHVFRSLQWLRGPHKNVNVELETIKLNIQSTMSSHQDNLPSYDNKKETFIFFKSFSKCLTNIKKSAEDKRFHQPLIVVGGLIIFQRFTGKALVLISFDFLVLFTDLLINLK